VKIVALKEQNETRVALVPASVKKLASLENVDVVLEQGLTDLFTPEEYEKAGAKFDSREALLSSADILLSVNKLSDSDIKKLKKGCMTISFLDPYNNKDVVDLLVEQGITSISMEMIPRTTLAQKMDALSSQASLAGYVAVMLGANTMDKIFPMMMTPAGTIKPAKVFIIGAGVAGLQAIATAKRLGAKVVAFDTRAVVKEQVESLGAKFLEIDLGETGQTKDGYAKALTEEQLKIQQKEMAKSCASSDLVITTAKLFGRKAPVIITNEILKEMKEGSVVVDLAAGTGGNVEGTVVDETTVLEGVKVIGIDNLPGEVAIDSSTMYASNLVNLITHFWDKESNTFNFNMEDEILAGCLITKDGQLVNERMISFYGGN
jgi:NAD(P) transhydrogenase subunit alpha